MQNHLMKYKDWLSESENPEVYELSQDDIDYINNNCKVLKELKKSELSKGLHKNSNYYIYAEISTKDLEKYVSLLEKVEVEFVPGYFEETNKIKISFYRDKKMENGKYLLDIFDAESLSHKVNARNFQIKWNADNKDQMLDIVNKSVEEIINEIKKVRVMIQVGKKILPDSLKPTMKKKMLENYRNVVDSFFYKGELPESGESDLGWIIAEIYSSDKTVLDTISDIKDRETLESILKALEKMGETEVIKIIKAYIRTSITLKLI